MWFAASDAADRSRLFPTALKDHRTAPCAQLYLAGLERYALHTLV